MAKYGCGSANSNIGARMRSLVEAMGTMGGQGGGILPAVIGAYVDLLVTMNKDQLDTKSAVRDLKDARGTIGRFPNDPHALGPLLDWAIAKLEAELKLHRNDEWERIFGHCWGGGRNFDAYNFGRVPDPKDEAEEFDFGRPIAALEALAEFEKMGREPASIWAQGRYINLHPQAARGASLAGIGARWNTSDYGDLFPTYRLNGTGIEIKLYSVHVVLGESVRFLVREVAK